MVSKGLGRVLIGDDGGLIHAPTREKLVGALNFVMDEALRFGLICQPVKVKPPAQEQKFCGFLYNSEDLPYLGIPVDKQSRAQALLQYILFDHEGPLARQTLAVVTGVLQSLVDATPSNIGSTFLRSFYDVCSAGLECQQPITTASYFDKVELTPTALADLLWWHYALKHGLARREQVRDDAVLGVTHGDGSGTGAGGTLEFFDPLGD